MRVYAVTLLCGLLGVSTQAYYKHGDTQMRKLAEESFVVEFIKRIRERDRGIGGSKLWRMYKKEFGEEHAVGYNRFYDIVDKYGLKVRKRRRRAKTTDSNHDYPTYPNLVKNMIPVRPNQLWVSDITYMVIYVDGSSGDYKFCYLSLVTDYYTKEIVGWCVGETLEAKFAVEALNMALDRLDKPNTWTPTDITNLKSIYNDKSIVFFSINENSLITLSLSLIRARYDCGKWGKPTMPISGKTYSDGSCLYTGDSILKKKQLRSTKHTGRYDNLMNEITKHCKNGMVDLFQIPHHGSSYNYNKQTILDSFFYCHFINCCDKEKTNKNFYINFMNCHKLPGTAVIITEKSRIIKQGMLLEICP